MPSIHTLCLLTGGKHRDIPVFLHPDGRVSFTADADIDADGANGQHGTGNAAYWPKPNDQRGLDDLRNAQTAGGGWCGVVTDNGQPNGRPIIQGPHDPCPGAFISPTSLHLLRADGSPIPASDPFKYVDAETVAGVVVSPKIIDGVPGIVLGCRVRITWRGRSVECVTFDVGPRYKCGEISIAAAKPFRDLGMSSSARSGGIEENEVLYELWPGIPAVLGDVTYPLQRFRR